MQLVFLGHQTWTIATEKTFVILDPILTTFFGNSTSARFRVYPPRSIDVAKMPAPRGVVLSHEHLDHFSIPSLSLLPRTVPFYVGTSMPACVVRAIETLGFEVTRVRHGETFVVDDLELTLFAGAHDTVFWEKRVTQLYAREARPNGAAVFIGVDALISEKFAAAVDDGVLPSPRAAILANNSQMPPPGSLGAYSNALPLPATDRADRRFPGMSILHSIVNETVEILPDVRDVILCGNGFINLAESFGPFLYSDNKRLAEIANELSVGGTGRIYGPEPGDLFELVGNDNSDPIHVSKASWVHPDIELRRELLARQANFLATPDPAPFESLTGHFAHDDEAQVALARAEAELARLAPELLRAPVGVLALETDEYLDGPLSARRLVVRLVGAPGGHAVDFALDVTEARFVRMPEPSANALAAYPFGVQIHLKDFTSMLDGKVQIWELAGNAMRSWFIGGVYENIVVFLFEYYGEQTRPDLAWKLYEGAIERARLEPTPG